MTTRMECRVELLEQKMGQVQESIERQSESIERQSESIERQSEAIAKNREMMREEVKLAMAECVQDLLKAINGKGEGAANFENLANILSSSNVGSSSNVKVVEERTESQLEKALAPVFDLRLRKLEIPIFAGDGPHEWLQQVEMYFKINRLTEPEKLEGAVLCLEGVALKWYNWANNRTPIKSWIEFRRELLRRFLPAEVGTIHERFFALKQITTVKDYREIFEDLSSTLILDDDTLQGKFIEGLKEDIKVELRLTTVTGLENIMEMTQKIEFKQVHFGGEKDDRSKLQDSSGSQGTTVNSGSGSRVISVSPNRATSLPKHDSFCNSEQSSVPPFKKLSESEILSWKAKGLCFRCDERYFNGQVAIVRDCEMVDELRRGNKLEADLDNGIEDDLKKVELHSKTEVENPKTLKLKEKIEVG